jgi:hypothetical protein
MTETPSHRRRKGREAFEPGVNPMDVQPYKIGTWGYEHHLLDWLEGWSEARRNYEKYFDKENKPCCPYCGKTL